MTLAAHGTPPLAFTSRTPSIVILGSDALLTALPATPVQLAHACLRVGFQHVVPASWGDELVARAMLRALEDRAGAPAIQCSCPLVAHRLLSVGTELHPFLVPLVSPPVALARYLRAVQGGAHPRITYVGRCPGADADSIDERLTPDELLAVFAERQVELLEQPHVFDSVIPPDRRRFLSQPGGVPTPEALWVDGGHRSLEELSGENFAAELAQLLLSDQEVLVNPAPALGCACAGALPLPAGRNGRNELLALEPPRSRLPVVDARVPVDLELRLDPLHAPPPPPPAPVVTPPATVVEAVRAQSPEREPEVVVRAAQPDAAPPEPPRAEPHHEQIAALVTSVEPDVPVASGPPSPVPQRHALENGVARTVQGEAPLARHADGRHLPRTWVLRKRHSPRSAMGAIRPEEPAPVLPPLQPSAESLAPEPVTPAKASPVDEVVASSGAESSPPTESQLAEVVSIEPEPSHSADAGQDVGDAGGALTEGAEPGRGDRTTAVPISVESSPPESTAAPATEVAGTRASPDAVQEDVRDNGAGGHAPSVNGAAHGNGAAATPLLTPEAEPAPQAGLVDAERTPARITERSMAIVLPLVAAPGNAAVAEQGGERRPARARAVELPIDHTAARPRRAPQAEHGPATEVPVAAAVTVPASKIGWKALVAMIALVALVSAAVGVAVGAYMMRR